MLVALDPEYWICIDSCYAPGQAEPVALSYLRKFGLDPAHVIRSIVVTHWHDDHTRGADLLYDIAAQAPLYASVAFQKREFHAFATATADTQQTSRPGTQAFTSILRRSLKNRDGRVKFVPEFASILHLPFDFGAGQVVVDLMTLSPTTDPRLPTRRICGSSSSVRDLSVSSAPSSRAA